MQIAEGGMLYIFYNPQLTFIFEPWDPIEEHNREKSNLEKQEIIWLHFR